MNCKPGDLAIIVRSVAGNEGKIVRCIKYAGKIRWLVIGGGEEFKESWEVDSLIRSIDGTRTNLIKDDQLRPISDPGEDAQDETLQWLPVPSTETVDA